MCEGNLSEVSLSWWTPAVNPRYPYTQGRNETTDSRDGNVMQPWELWIFELAMYLLRSIPNCILGTDDESASGKCSSRLGKVLLFDSDCLRIQARLFLNPTNKFSRFPVISSKTSFFSLSAPYLDLEKFELTILEINSELLPSLRYFEIESKEYTEMN
jgi:hypothetical protein